MQRSLKDLLAGGIFVGLGLYFAITAWGYDLGSPIRLGPGAFPLILAGVLVLLGLIIVAEGFFAGEEGPVGIVPWRGLLLILPAILFFGFTIRGLGLVPALFVTVFASALASRRAGFVTAAILAAALTVFCTLIFVVALGLPVRLVGPWLGF